MSDDEEKPAVFPDAQSWLSSTQVSELKMFIEIEGQPARIYAQNSRMNGPTSLVSGCIEGTPGGRFKICYWDQRRIAKAALGLYYFLEGELIHDGTSQKTQTYFKLPIESEERIVELSEERSDEHHIRTFSFGAVPSTEDIESATTDTTTIRQVGSIDVCLSPLKSCRRKRPSDPDDCLEWAQPELSKTLHESEKKAQFALAACMEAAEMTDAEFDETCWVTKRLDEDNPAVIYSFEVWSRAGLEMKGLVDPLPPEIELVRDQSPPLAADNAELAAIEAQILALQQRADALRGDDEKKIKVARPQAGSQAERDGGVIEKGGTIYIDFDEDEIE